MASKQTYECFTCKNDGFPGVMVYLAGKDAQGRAIRLEDDGTTPHQHKTKLASSSQQQQSQGQPQQGQPQQGQPMSSTTLVTEPTSLKIINAKLDRIIALLESQQK